MKDKLNFSKETAAISNVKFGENVKVIEPSNLYDCELQDNVFIGPFVEIQSEVFLLGPEQKFNLILLYALKFLLVKIVS